MLHLNTRINFNEVVPAHLVNQELRCARIPVLDALRELNGIGQYRLPDLFGQMRRRRDLDNLLVTSLHGAVGFKEMDGVAFTIREDLHFDMARPLEETLDEDGSVAECGLGLAHSAVERVLEVALLTDNTHTTASSAHSRLDNDCTEKINVMRLRQ